MLPDTLKYPPAYSSHINPRKPLRLTALQTQRALLSLINSKLRRNMIGVSSYRDTVTKLIIRISEARQNISWARLSKSTKHSTYSALGSLIREHP